MWYFNDFLSIHFYVKKITFSSTFFEYFILIICIKYEVIISFTGITAKKSSPTVHLNDILLENDQKLMQTFSVYIHRTETPTDQPRELPNYQRYLAQFGIVIEVGKAVISVPFGFQFVSQKKIF